VIAGIRQGDGLAAATIFICSVGGDFSNRTLARSRELAQP